MYIYISKCVYIPWHTHIYVCACICLHIEIWKYRCEHVQNNQLIHKHIHLSWTFYQSRHWMIGRHVDIIHVRVYLWICIWIHRSTFRNNCNWCTLNHLVLVRINGFQKWPKMPRNTFSDTLLKSWSQIFAPDAAKKKRVGGSHGKKWWAPSINFYQERCTQPFVSLVPSPSATSSFSPPSDDMYCQVCQSPFDEHQMLLCDICNTGWYMVYLLPPLTTIPHGIWKCPLVLPRHLLPQTTTFHLRLPSPILDFDSD